MRAGTNPSPRIIATSALDHLYQIDNPAELKECLNAFLTAVKGSFTTLSKKDEDALIASVINGEKTISPELYQRYADNFRRAVDAVPIDDTDLSAQWHANVSRFAAYKAYHATEELRRIAEDEDGDMAFLRATLHKYNRYQAAEYNTAVARARTGKQWLSFNDPDNARLFPYIEWLPSRSATPREAHRIFWNCRWPKGDHFWKENQPGTLWNCKCDWQETDEEPDPQKNKAALDKAEEMKQIAAEANKPNPLCLPGLDKNPATSGQIFTDSAPYIKKAPRVILDDDTNKLLPSLQSLLNADQNAFRIDYYSDNGGLLLTSRNRIKEGLMNKQEKEKFSKEHSMCRTLASNDFNVTYLESVQGSYDVTLNGIPAELKKVDSSKQIYRHARKAFEEQGAKSVVIEIATLDAEAWRQLNKIKAKGWKCYYYTSSDRKVKLL